jgi:hypothetical protein
MDYTGKHADVVGRPDPRIVVSAADVLDEDDDETTTPRGGDVAVLDRSRAVHGPGLGSSE